MVDFGGRYIYRNHHDDIEYQQICSRHMDKSMKHFLTKMLMMTIGFTAAVMGPTYAFIFNGIRTTTFDAAVPYAEEKSLVEFSVNSMIQLLNATYGALIYLGMEVAMELFSNIITISPRLIEHKLRKIISDYAENQITPSQLHFAFMDFVKQLSDANEYVSIDCYQQKKTNLKCFYLLIFFFFLLISSYTNKLCEKCLGSIILAKFIDSNLILVLDWNVNLLPIHGNISCTFNETKN